MKRTNLILITLIVVVLASFAFAGKQPCNAAAAESEQFTATLASQQVSILDFEAYMREEEEEDESASALSTSTVCGVPVTELFGVSNVPATPSCTFTGTDNGTQCKICQIDCMAPVLVDKNNNTWSTFRSCKNRYLRYGCQQQIACLEPGFGVGFAAMCRKLAGCAGDGLKYRFRGQLRMKIFSFMKRGENSRMNSNKVSLFNSLRDMVLRLVFSNDGVSVYIDYFFRSTISRAFETSCGATDCSRAPPGAVQRAKDQTVKVLFKALKAGRFTKRQIRQRVNEEWNNVMQAEEQFAKAMAIVDDWAKTMVAHDVAGIDARNGLGDAGNYNVDSMKRLAARLKANGFGNLIKNPTYQAVDDITPDGILCRPTAIRGKLRCANWKYVPKPKQDTH